MSYILDAIRKSEQQRQRGIGPSLYAPLTSSHSEKPRSFLLYSLVAAGLIFLGMLINFLHPWQQGKVNNTRASSLASVSTKVDEVVLPKTIPPQTVPLEAAVQREPEQAAPLKKLLSTEAHNEPDTKNTKQVALESIKVGEPSPKPQTVIASKPLPKEPTAHITNNPVTQSAEKVLLAETAPAIGNRPNETAQEQKIMAISELPLSIQQEIPKMSIPGYTFSNNPKESTVGINDRLLQEGDSLIPGLRLERISPDGLVFSYKNYLFRQSL